MLPDFATQHFVIGNIGQGLELGGGGGGGCKRIGAHWSQDTVKDYRSDQFAIANRPSFKGFCRWL